MPDQAFLGQISMWGGNFTMRGTAFCNGQLLAIQQNSALFSLLGTYYGGDGRTTFALPNFIGNVPVGQGTPTFGSFVVGQSSGVATVSLLSTEIPPHNHNNQLTAALSAGGAPGNGTLISDPIGAYPATVANGTNLYANAAGSGAMTPLTSNLDSNTSIAGGSQPHNNMQPYLAVTFVIALQGIFPARN